MDEWEWGVFEQDQERDNSPWVMVGRPHTALVGAEAFRDHMNSKYPSEFKIRRRLVGTWEDLPDDESSGVQSQA